LLRMKQRNMRLRDDVWRQHMIGLVTIAHGACETQILKRRWSADGSRDDVLQFEGGGS
jgi:hypothetical protein